MSGRRFGATGFQKICHESSQDLRLLHTHAVAQTGSQVSPNPKWSERSQANDSPLPALDQDVPSGFLVATGDIKGDVHAAADGWVCDRRGIKALRLVDQVVQHG